MSVTSALSCSPNIIAGNALVGCPFNMMFILGIAAIIHPVKLSRSLLRTDMPLYFVALALLALLVNTRDGPDMTEGVILLVCNVAFLVVTGVRGARGGTGQQASPVRSRPATRESPPRGRRGELHDMVIDIVVLTVCVAALRFGTGFAVDGAWAIAQTLGISERIIGLTVISIGTSLPRARHEHRRRLKGQHRRRTRQRNRHQRLQHHAGARRLRQLRRGGGIEDEIGPALETSIITLKGRGAPVSENRLAGAPPLSESPGVPMENCYRGGNIFESLFYAAPPMV